MFCNVVLINTVSLLLSLEDWAL